MKAVMMLFDTLCRNMLEPYGCTTIKTPNFTRLAEKAAVFDNYYVGSMPCIPARRDLHTGRYNMLHRGWGPLEPFDESFCLNLRQAGIYSHLVTDHHHYFDDGGATYHYRYDTWDYVRGQEAEKWKAVVNPPELKPYLGIAWKQDGVNRPFMMGDDLPQRRLIRHATEFIETNKDADRWFLQIEVFDPHEPFFTGKDAPDYQGKIFDWPTYGPVDVDADGVKHINDRYAELLEICDHSLGSVLDLFDKYDMWKDTMLIVNTDHGFLLGEHGWFGKCVQPFFNEIANIPLFIYDPRIGIIGEHRTPLVQMIDIAPTILEFFNAAPLEYAQGRPLKDVIRMDTEVDAIHEGVLFGMHGSQVNVCDGRYIYMRGYNKRNKPLYDYILMPMHMRGMFTVEELRTARFTKPFSFTKGIKLLKVESNGFSPSDEGVADLSNIDMQELFATKLYDLEADPWQKAPINDKKIEIRMKKLLIELMRQSDAPKEQYKRLGLK